MVQRERIVNTLWIVVFGLLSTGWCWSAANSLGPTFDEPFYLRAGLKNWRDLNHRELLTQGTMPLAGEVQTLPLRLAEIFTSADPERDWLDWLPIARLGTLVFLWLLLWASFRLGTQYGGTWGGRLAVALVACEPILLGHSSLATTDVAFTACLLTLLAVFRGRRDEVSWVRRLAVPAIWFALTYLAKASAILFVPMCLLMIELERLWSSGWRPGRTLVAWNPALTSMRELMVLAALGTGLLFIVCPRCLRGLLYQIRYQSDFKGESFLLGEYSEQGFAHYFAAALAIKLALPVLVLLVVMLILRPRYLLNGAILAAIGLLTITPMFRIQTGVRYVLPIAVLALVGASAAFTRWWSEQPAGTWRTVPGGFAAALVLWSLTTACLVWPNGMCYTNELFGGPRQGHLALTESNIDWGQGLNELADWQKKHPEATLHLWYFGTDPRCTAKPFHAICPASFESGEELRRLCEGGYLAASKSHVPGYFHNTPAGRYLQTLTPVDQTSTYLIYDFRPAGLALSQRQ